MVIHVIGQVEGAHGYVSLVGKHTVIAQLVAVLFGRQPGGGVEYPDRLGVDVTD